jgi:hypothetical protein
MPSIHTSHLERQKERATGTKGNELCQTGLGAWNMKTEEKEAKGRTGDVKNTKEKKE